nr:MAG TPA: endonuclease-like protein [Caudoviricetes sp.]
MRKITKEELARDIIETCEKYNDYSLGNYKEHGSYSWSLLYKRFGYGWRKTLKELSIKPTEWQCVKKEDLVKDLKETFERTGTTLREEYLKNGKYSRAPIKRIFGNWNNMLKELGYSFNMYKPGQYSREDILEDYKQVSLKHGFYVNAFIYRKEGKFSQQIVDSTFGSFSEMRRLLGLKVDGKVVSNDEIRQSILKLVKKYKKLTTEIINLDCVVSYPTIESRFGSLYDLLEELKIDPNKYVHRSGLHLKAIDALKEVSKLKFEEEKTFPWLINPTTGYHLRVDIYISEINLAIEVDGEQHFRYIPKIHQNIENFILYLQRDLVKEELLKKHNINLLRLSFVDVRKFKKKIKQYLEKKVS